MKKLVLGAVLVAGLFAAAPLSAQADVSHNLLSRHHRAREVCHFRHGHRVCHWVR